MKIPTEIIEKAIAGGWPPENVGKLFPSDIVLNSEFWKCLGKAGEMDRSHYGHCNLADGSGTDCTCYSNKNWSRIKAFNFYSLIYDKAPQEQIDAFWKELQN